MKHLLLVLLALSLSAEDYIPNIDLPSIEIHQSYQSYQHSNTPEPQSRYPKQTDTQSDYMHDYRTPSYDIYSYELAPVD